MNIKSKSFNLVVCIIIAMATVAALYCTYQYHFTTPILVIIWLGWFIASSSLVFFTDKGQQVFAFMKESKIELQKVVWPTRQETVQTTVIVMVMVLVAGFVLWLIDSGMLWTIGKITHLG